MALVIWRVFFTLRMRRLKSRTFAMWLVRWLPLGFAAAVFFQLALRAPQEVLLVFLERGVDAVLEIIVQRLLVDDVVQQLRTASRSRYL